MTRDGKEKWDLEVGFGGLLNNFSDCLLPAWNVDARVWE